MILPTIHHNGTSKDSLISDLCGVSAALELAYQAMKQASPNGRDYYPQGADAIGIATNEHMDRLRRLDALKTEIDTMTRAIDEANP